MCFRSSFLLAFVFLVSGLAVAQQQSQRDPQALLVVQQSLAAMGGATAAAQVTDAVCTGAVQPVARSQVKASTFTWKIKGTDFRYQSSTGSSTRIFVSGHGHPASVRDGVVKALSPHMALANPPFELPALVLAPEASDTRYTVTLGGSSTVEGTAAIKVHTRLETDVVTSLVTAQDWYFDVVTRLPLRVEHRLPDNLRPDHYVNAAEEYSDFRVVSGMLVPFRISLYEDGVQVAIVTLDSVKFNQGLSGADFDAPQGGGQ